MAAVTTLPNGPIAIHRELDLLVDTLRHIWQRRWIGIAVAWGIALVSATVLLLVHDRYESRTRIYIDTQTMLQPLLRDIAVQPDVDQMYAMIARTLISRPNLEKIIDNAGLDKTLETPEAREQLIEALSKGIKVTPGGGKNLFDIVYRDTDADRSLRVVQELVTVFLSSSERYKRRDSEEASKFINAEIERYEKSLEEAETKLKNFKLKNVTVTAASGRAGGQDFFARIDAADQELSRVRVDLRGAELARDSLSRVVAAQESAAANESPAVPDLSKLDTRLEAQLKQLDDLRHRYTEEHPDVVSARRMIDQLRAERARDMAEQNKLPPEARDTIGSVSSQQIKVKLADAEAAVASLKGREAELSSRLNELRREANMVPQVEAELARLNRDYEVIKKNYDQLVQRRESASISGHADQMDQGAAMKIIDPPRVGDKPVFPARAILVPLALLLSVLAGAGVSLAVNRLQPIVCSVGDLRGATQRPVLGVVSEIAEEATRHSQKEANMLFAVASAVLVLSYGAWTVLLALGVH